MKGRAIAVAAALALLALPSAAEAASVQPGDRVIAGSARCTLAFVVAGPEGIYFATAGHCIELGQEARVEGVGRLGVAAFSSNGPEGRDFALVLVDPAHHAIVRSEIRAWGGPTGVYREPGDKLDEVRFFGQGVLFGDFSTTQPRKGIGPSWREGASDFYFKGQGVPGDSGSPVVHESGLALGVLVTLRAASDGNTNGGTHLDAGLALARESGIHARLVLAGEDPVRVMESLRAPPSSESKSPSPGPGGSPRPQTPPTATPPGPEEPLAPSNAPRDDPTARVPLAGLEFLAAAGLAAVLWSRRR